jgi:hypothetical protein
MSLLINQFIQCHIPQDDVDTHCHEDFKSQEMKLGSWWDWGRTKDITPKTSKIRIYKTISTVVLHDYETWTLTIEGHNLNYKFFFIKSKRSGEYVDLRRMEWVILKFWTITRKFVIDVGYIVGVILRAGRKGGKLVMCLLLRFLEIKF